MGHALCQACHSTACPHVPVQMSYHMRAHLPATLTTLGTSSYLAAYSRTTTAPLLWPAGGARHARRARHAGPPHCGGLPASQLILYALPPLLYPEPLYPEPLYPEPCVAARARSSHPFQTHAGSAYAHAGHCRPRSLDSWMDGHHRNPSMQAGLVLVSLAPGFVWVALTCCRGSGALMQVGAACLPACLPAILPRGCTCAGQRARAHLAGRRPSSGGL